MKNSFNRLNFNFERKNKEIGMCTDEAAVNHAVYNQLFPSIYQCFVFPARSS